MAEQAGHSGFHPLIPEEILYNHAVTPANYRLFPDSILEQCGFRRNHKKFTIPEYLRWELLYFADHVPELEALPLTLDPMQVRAFVVCSLLKLPVYVTKPYDGLNYRDGHPDDILVRPSFTSPTPPPSAKRGVTALKTFSETYTRLIPLWDAQRLSFPDAMPSRPLREECIAHFREEPGDMDFVWSPKDIGKLPSDDEDDIEMFGNGKPLHYLRWRPDSSALAKKWVPGRDRLPPIPDDQLSDAQRAAAEEFRTERGVPIFGPFWPILRSPGLLTAANQLGMFCRYGTSLPAALSELLILITAAHWHQPVEWNIHYPIAVENGVAESVLEDVRDGFEPEGLSLEQDIIWSISCELQRTKKVTDVTWRKAVAAFGEEGVMDVLGIVGYYTMLSMVMNAAQTAVPKEKLKRKARTLSEAKPEPLHGSGHGEGLR